MSNGVIVQPILATQYRLSRVYSGGVDLQTYNRVICFNPEYTTAMSPYFLEGFKAFGFIVESASTSWNFRKQTLTPQMLFEFDRFKVIGSEINDPELRSRLSINPAPAGFKINNEEEIDSFSVTFRDIDVSHGDGIDTYNSKEYGTNTNINFYDRDVQSINRQRNIFSERGVLNSSPAPEKLTEQILEKW